MLDKNVTWTEQIEYLSSKLSSSAGIFSKLRYYLNTKTLLDMYHALFNSHLQYAILCWGSTSATNLQRLQIFQNRAIRNMMKAPRYFRLDNYFLNLRILKVKDLYNFEIAKFMHGHYNNLLPICFMTYFQEMGETHSYNTRSVNNRNYSSLICRTSRGQRSIKFYGPKIWNQTPVHMKNESKTKFKKLYKEFILSQY